MSVLKKTLYALFFVLLSLQLSAQLKDSSVNMVLIKVNYSLHAPSGDIADRFGVSHMIGAGVEYKFKNNWSLGLDCNYLFGGYVKDSTILDHLKDQNGGIINEYGEYGTTLMTERGFYAGGSLGKLIPILGSNPNSGLKFELGVGLLQHHIHIENKDNNIPAVIGDYKKGYDRLSNGLSLNQFVGYQFIDSKGRFNFYAGVEFYEAFTYNRRNLNFDTGLVDNALHKDYLWGLNVGWIIPIYKKAPQDFYYF